MLHNNPCLEISPWGWTCTPWLRLCSVSSSYVSPSVLHVETDRQRSITITGQWMQNLTRL